MNRYLALLITTVVGMLSIIGLHAQTATLLPNAIQYFMDNNGKPLSNGKVYFYVPPGTTPKTVWSDPGETTPITQPVQLGTSGRPTNPIYGDGIYRQVVKDQFNNVIWDFNTASTGGSGGGSAPAFSEGVMVGSIIPWANTVLPAKYLYTAGQEVSRTTFSALFTAITWSQPILCVSGIATITVSAAISDSLPIGAPIEASCFAPGTTVVAKTTGQLTMSTPATTTVSVTAILFPWGNGDGSTTFNVPDLRGRTLVGPDNMNGTAAGVLSSLYFGSNPSAVNAKGGAQFATISTRAFLPPYTLQTTIFDPGHAHTFATSGTGFIDLANATPGNNAGSTTTNFAFTGITASTASGGGGLAVSATIGSGGSGYTNGAQLLTVSGGTCSVQPVFSVTVSGGVASAPVLSNAGYCTVAPAPNPVATTGGGGTGATLNVTYAALPLPVIQPSVTTQYIIKALPDDSPTGPGVTSLGGMTGAIACGTNVTCTGNTISVNVATGVSSVNTKTGAVTIAGGTNITVDSSGPNIVINGGALASDYYLATTGNDANSCTVIGAPCLTLAHIASIINASGSTGSTTVHVAAGTYTAGARFSTGTVNIVGAGSGTTKIADTTFAPIQASGFAKVTPSAMWLTESVTSVIYAEERGIVTMGSDLVLGENPLNPAAILLAQNDGAIYGSNFTVNGSAGSIWNLQRGYSRLFGDPPIVTFTNSPALGAIVVTENTSVLKTSGAQFTGSASVTQQYGLTGNSTLDQEQNATELPGAQGALTGGSTYYNAGLQFTGVISGSSGTTALLTASGITSGLGYLGVGQQIIAPGGATYMQIASFGTGTGKNGTYNLTCVTACINVASVGMQSSSIYPCISTVGLCPAIVAGPTGLGTGGTAVVSNDSWGGDYGGTVTITSGSAATGSSGILYVIPHSQMSNCTASVTPKGGALASVSVQTGTSGGRFYIQLPWTSSGALATSTTYGITYNCH